MNSALYVGTVRHRRFAPVENAFRYHAFWVYLDLDELDEAFRGRWLWSARRPAPAWFRRADHLGDPARPLDACVRDLVEREAGFRPRGPVRLLTHLRYFGYVFNPVSFYYCFAPDGPLDAIVAEIHNTPWNERHCHVLDARAQVRVHGPHGALRFAFAKEFHVSPFMPMAIDYAWRFVTPGRGLAVHMENRAGGNTLFDATLVLARRPMTGANLAAALARHPLMTVEVIAAIYGQALRLWWKRCPAYPHPGEPPRRRAA